MSLDFDTDFWYQINATRLPGYSLLGTPLYNENDTTGAVRYETTNASEPGQSWQIYPFNSSAYLLRCKDSGPYGYLAVAVSTDDDTAGQSLPIMASFAVTDDNMFWQIQSWDDGTYYFTNLANGSDWQLNAKANARLAMTSDIASTQIGEHYVFATLSTIGDSQYSTVNAHQTTSGTTVATTTSSETGTATATGATSSPSQGTGTDGSGHRRLSTGAAIGIGIGVGLVGLIITALLGWFVVRRRRGTKPHSGGTPAAAEVEDKPTRPWSEIHEMKTPANLTEMPTTSTPPIYEAWAPPSELQGDDTRR